MTVIADCILLPRSEFPQDAVRNSTPIADADAVWHESWAPRSLRRGVGAPVLAGGHSGRMVGRVNLIYEHAGHHRAELELDDSADIEVGRAVSIDLESFDWDDDTDLHLRRHGLSTVRHVAILRRGARPRYAEARVVSLTRVEPRWEREPEPELVMSREEPRLLRRNCGLILGVS